MKTTAAERGRGRTKPTKRRTSRVSRVRSKRSLPPAAPTPGPWKTGKNGDDCAAGHAICADGFVIAKVYGRGYPVTKGWSPASQADANLIAEAPALLRLVKAYMAATDRRPIAWVIAVTPALEAADKDARELLNRLEGTTVNGGSS